MKVSLNSKFVEGPSGGGMQFAKYLKKFLSEHGVLVVNDLRDDDIDIILHVTPFPYLMSLASYSYHEAYAYKIEHPNTIIIQRINECDERKRTDYMNGLLIDASKYSDYVVYISSWLKYLLEKSGMNKDMPSSVILNGADNAVFNTRNKIFWNGKDKLRIVTHHWGGNFMKGHDIYKKLDELLSNKSYSEKFEFTFIGNYPKDIRYKNTRLIPPLSGLALAEELKRHHVYLTATRNEPAGMHHIEGALCGLPVLYINSGALPEYCSGFGIEFDENDFEKKMIQMNNEYNYWSDKVPAYSRTSEYMCGEFYELFLRLYENKDTIDISYSYFSRVTRKMGLRISYLSYLIKIMIIKLKILSEHGR